MKKLLASTLLLCAAGTAHAATIDVVCSDSVSLPAIVAAAQPRDIIQLSTPVGDEDCLFRIDEQILVTKVLTIRGMEPPREVDGEGIEPQVNLWVDPAIIGGSGAEFTGAFVVDGGTNRNGNLTFENIKFKLPEAGAYCDDNFDNDGNGLADNDDPYCLAAGLGNNDTATIPVPVLDESITGIRAFNVLSGTLTIRSSEFQGFGYASDGAVVRATGADITIEDSRFSWNWTSFEAVDSGDFTRGRGAVFASNSSFVDIRNTFFGENRRRYGGALYIQDSELFVTDGCEFSQNYAEDGGAIFLEQSYAEILGNTFSANSASVVPKDRLFLTYEGGAVFSEDSDMVVQNNVFLWNTSLDWGATMTVRRSLAGEDPGGRGIAVLIENNSFVENVAGLVGGASVMIDSTIEFKYNNNISFGEISGAIGATNWPFGAAPNVHYSLFFPLLPDEVYTGELSGLSVNQRDNLFADPRFVYYTEGMHADWRIWRFWLDPLSPAIDTGDPLVFDNGDTSNRSDMGAYGGNVPNAQDEDGDGWPNVYDCDDQDPNVQPYAFEGCNDKDDDCNGIVDDREALWYEDRDFDGYGRTDKPPVEACPEQALPPLAQGVYVNRGGDCDDTTTIVNPGRTEFCDGVDNDCDLQFDENIPVRLHYIDRDLDGFGDADPRYTISVACPPEGYSPFSTDCNDRDLDIHPLITFEARSHFPLADAPLERHEADRDPRYVADGGDQDCDGFDLCYPDFDRDTYGQRPDAGQEPLYAVDNDRNCRNLSAFTASNNTDCDDGDARSHPGGVEVAGDGLDQDCDDRDDCYEDLDDDGFGTDVIVPDNDLDCDNGQAATSSQTGDCADDPDLGGEQQNPTKAEVCDGLDNNCDGTIDEVQSANSEEFYRDADGDGFGNVVEKIRACGQPLGYARRAGDCDDEDQRAYPGNSEVCDGIDNNCEAGVDEDAAIDVITWYEDLDGDGYGNADLFQESCVQPTDGGRWVPPGQPLDCNDADAATGPCPDLCGDCSNLGPRGGFSFALGLLSVAMLRRRRAA